MRNKQIGVALVVTAVMVAISREASASDWIVAPSYYTHDPQSGERVNQYTPIGPVYTYPRGDYASSGYRNTRSSIRYGGTADHYHRVEQWGPPVRPYGEWQFPYRPYSVPFPLWASPYDGMFRFYGPGSLATPPQAGHPGTGHPGWPGGGGGWPGGGGGWPGGGGGWPGGGGGWPGGGGGNWPGGGRGGGNWPGTPY